ncbi:unnamed protein product, partial [Medioppia subpectinata]
MKILILHPDLGIGGAERLIVDAGMAFKSLSHEVHIVTTHHDKSHCFEETIDGSLEVTVVADWLPRSLFNRFYALMAYYRMIIAAIYVVFFSGLQFDLIFCDSISACIPVLRLSKKKVVFYCHFPDQLLTQRKTILKRLYRYPIDWLEEWTTENKQHYEELVNKAVELGVEDKVSFLKSPSNDKKQLLLHSCTALLYTPDNEHFGIVPLEAMYMSRPVIAVNSGGPRETVIDNETGFLCQPNAKHFANAMK